MSRNITKYLLKNVSCIKLFNTHNAPILNIFSYFCNVFCISYEETQKTGIPHHFSHVPIISSFFELVHISSESSSALSLSTSEVWMERR